MKSVVSFFFLLVGSIAFAADLPDDPAAIFATAYLASQKAEKFEMSNSTADAIQSYREADKLLKVIREKHPQWKEAIVEYRAQRVAKALKRLVAVSEAKKSE